MTMRRAAAILVLALLVASARPAAAGVGMGVIEEDPRAAHERWKEKAEEYYKDGMKARAAGDQRGAVTNLMRALKIGQTARIDSPYPQKAADELTIIAEEARKDFVVARELLAGEDPQAGLSELQRILRTYLGLPAAKRAGQMLRELEKDPRFQAQLKSGRLTEELDKAVALEAAAAALAAGKTAEELAPASADEEVDLTAAPKAPASGGGAMTVRARELTPDERLAARTEKLVAAYEIYTRVAREGADTAPGLKATAALDRLKGDEAILARIRQAQAENQAREWLSLANNYFRAGRFDLAREHCARIIEKCPQTPQAEEAKSLMEQMKK
jgi:tetratricopeptide (TPR) repeat protein